VSGSGSTMNSIAAAPIHRMRSLDANIVLAIFFPAGSQTRRLEACHELPTPVLRTAPEPSAHYVWAASSAAWHHQIPQLSRWTDEQCVTHDNEWRAGLIELIGGVLIVIGLFTRPVAFIISGMTAVAYFYAHAHQGFFPILNRGELAVLYCFVFLYLAAAGGGAFSLDRLWHGDND